MDSAIMVPAFEMKSLYYSSLFGSERIQDRTPTQ